MRKIILGIGAFVSVTVTVTGGGVSYAGESVEEDVRTYLETLRGDETSLFGFEFGEISYSPSTQTVIVPDVLIRSKDNRIVLEAEQVQAKKSDDGLFDFLISKGTLTALHDQDRLSYAVDSIRIEAMKNPCRMISEWSSGQARPEGAGDVDLWQGWSARKTMFTNLRVVVQKEEGSASHSFFESYAINNIHDGIADSITKKNAQTGVIRSGKEVMSLSFGSQEIRNVSLKSAEHGFAEDPYSFMHHISRDGISLKSRVDFDFIVFNDIKFKKETPRHRFDFSVGAVGIKDIRKIGGIMASQTLFLEDVQVPVSAEFLSGLRPYLSKTGQDRVSLSASISYASDPEKKTFRFGPVSAEISGLGEMEAEAIFSGIDTLALYRQAGLEGRTFSDFLKRVLGQKPNLVSASVTYQDEILADLLLDEESNGNREAFAGQAVADLKEYFADPQGNFEGIAQEMTEAVRTFILKPDCFRIEIVPEEPIPVDKVLSLLFIRPTNMMSVLGLKVHAR